jgi:hypothetical protein
VPQACPDLFSRRKWSPALAERFLDHLATYANVQAAATACGLSRQSVYKLRRRDPAFARAWDAALTQLREQAEAQMAEMLEAMQRRAAEVSRRRNSISRTASP